MSTISAIVITKDEEAKIAGCLESLRFTDEIILVDAESTDKTREIASQYTDKIFVKEWMGFARAKQFALEQAAGEWVLWLDADERITETLAGEISRAVVDIDRPEVSAFKMPRKASFLGRWIKHGGWYPGHVMRLFRREKGRFGSERVHERLMVEGEVAFLKGEIEHYTDDSIGHYLHKFNKYTSLAAEDLFEKHRRTKLLDLLIRPVFMFIKMYFLKSGFLDGRQGFLLAVFSAFYVFTKYAKLWEIRKFPEVNTG